MSLKILAGPVLVESPLSESAEEFAAAVEMMLLQFYSKRPDWLHFTVGARFRRGAAQFRELVCPAGSVYGHLILRGTSRRGLPRAVAYRVEVAGGMRAFEIRDGVESEICPDELHAA